MGSLLNQIVVSVKDNRDKAELLNDFLLQCLLLRPALRNPRPWGKERKAGERKTYP